ncbi:recombinase family protein [Sphingobium sp. HWE2-09]|uniref:recombinase family protein n=1 Tax=Sphingobium sp. HWE2-09 TaxID=3108390 RepID=UPI002DC58BFC|nr:recombinase family protein [Sphingobium sp. HWE2-09]
MEILIMAGDGFEGKRVVIYARVSTSRQEKNDLSLPDQIETCERWIEENSATPTRIFSEAGSAMDDSRPRFQKMIAWTESDEHPVDIVLVHSLSRLFRNALDFM